MYNSQGLYRETKGDKQKQKGRERERERERKKKDIKQRVPKKKHGTI
jgi:hypothetical protein